MRRREARRIWGGVSGGNRSRDVRSLRLGVRHLWGMPQHPSPGQTESKITSLYSHFPSSSWPEGTPKSAFSLPLVTQKKPTPTHLKIREVIGEKIGHLLGF